MEIFGFIIIQAMSNTFILCGFDIALCDLNKILTFTIK